MRIFCLIVFFAVISCPSLAAEKLNLPFEVRVIEDEEAVPSSYKCPGHGWFVPKHLQFESVYDQTDPTRSKVDKRAQEKYRKKTRKIAQFENALIRITNDYIREGSVDEKKAQCALDWLYYWARKDALQGKVNDTGEAVRQWTLASLSSAYAQIAHEKDLDLEKRKVVVRWLRQTAWAVVHTYPDDTEIKRKQNNHLYWAAWAVGNTGMALNDPKLFDWAIGKARFALSQIAPDGTLPLELARGPKAIHYHHFAAIPLVMLAEGGLRNGINLYEESNGRLHRLIKRVLGGMDDMSYFEEVSGFEQDTMETFDGAMLAWMEVYHSRFPTSFTRKWIDKYSPLFLRRTGGDMSLLYGAE